MTESGSLAEQLTRLLDARLTEVAAARPSRLSRATWLGADSRFAHRLHRSGRWSQPGVSEAVDRYLRARDAIMATWPTWQRPSSASWGPGADRVPGARALARTETRWQVIGWFVSFTRRMTSPGPDPW